MLKILGAVVPVVCILLFLIGEIRRRRGGIGYALLFWGGEALLLYTSLLYAAANRPGQELLMALMAVLQDIYQRFNNMVQDKTAISISHRMSSCRFCDTVIVFDGGRIVQTGSHERLLGDKEGIYSRMWEAQAKYYV